MRTIKIVLLIALVLLIQIQIKAQRTAYYENVQKDIELSKEIGETAPLSWWGSNDTDPSTIACLTQKNFYK